MINGKIWILHEGLTCATSSREHWVLCHISSHMVKSFPVKISDENVCHFISPAHLSLSSAAIPEEGSLDLGERVSLSYSLERGWTSRAVYPLQTFLLSPGKPCPRGGADHLTYVPCHTSNISSPCDCLLWRTSSWQRIPNLDASSSPPVTLLPYLASPCFSAPWLQSFSWSLRNLCSFTSLEHRGLLKN